MMTPGRYLGELVCAIPRGWDRFFFQPADPRPLGVIRIVMGLMLLWTLGNYAWDLPDFFGEHSWVNQETLEEMQARRENASQRTALTWSLWNAIPASAMPYAWVGAILVAASLTMGLFSPVMAPLAVVIVISTARRSPFGLYGFDQVLSLWLLYLAVCGASGQAFSLDRWWSLRRKSRSITREPHRDPPPSIAANLGIRLIQLHLCVIYGFAGLAKLQGETWWNGAAVGLTIANAEFSPFNLTPLLAYPLMINALTFATLLIEISYPILIWNRLWRPILILSALGMHLGIALTMGLYEFGLAMAAGNLAFLRWGKLERIEGSQTPSSS